MNRPPQLRLVETTEAAEPSPPTPSTPTSASFTRVVTSPAAAPWRQRKIAELDARHGSPLPLGQVAYQLRRLAPWRPGEPARFAVTYVRCEEGQAAQPQQSRLGELFIALAPARAPGRRSGPVSADLILLLCVVAALALSTTAVVAALERRQETQIELADLQLRATLQERRAAAAALLKRQDLALSGLGASERSPERVLSDMAWISRHRRPGVSIGGFHWQRGVAAIETSTSDMPFIASDRVVQRAVRPLRSGVWLWGVEPERVNPGPQEAR